MWVWRVKGEGGSSCMGQVEVSWSRCHPGSGWTWDASSSSQVKGNVQSAGSVSQTRVGPIKNNKTSSKFKGPSSWSPLRGGRSSKARAGVGQASKTDRLVFWCVDAWFWWIWVAKEALKVNKSYFRERQVISVCGIKDHSQHLDLAKWLPSPWSSMCQRDRIQIVRVSV